MDYTSVDDGTGPGGNQTIVYAVSDSPGNGASFDIIFEAICAGLFWLLLIVHAIIGLLPVIQGTVLRMKRYPLYLMLLAYVVLTCVCESIALSYTLNAQKGHANDGTYLAYIFFWHASSASFLTLLLALSSGYCITRGTLEDHRGKVLVIPAIVFIAGIASDYTFVYVKSTQQLSTAADRYEIVNMTVWESAVWFIGSLANIMCFILAWIYVFDSTQLELKALDEAQAALAGREARRTGDHDTEEEDEDDPAVARKRRDAAEADTDEDDAPLTSLPHGAGGSSTPNGQRSRSANGAGISGGGQKRPLGTTSQRVGLLYGMEDSAAARDEEQGVGGTKETVADHMEYTVRKTLLSRFYFGVCTYLVVSIMVILLPAFFNTDLQNAIVVLQFVVKFLFTVMLAWIFRPSKDSPYLQVGISDNDADDRGVSALDTELAVTEYKVEPNAGPRAPLEPLERPGQGKAKGERPTIATQAFGAGSAPLHHPPQLPISLPAADGVPPRRARGPYASLPGDGPGQQGQKPRFTLDEDE